MNYLMKNWWRYNNANISKCIQFLKFYEEIRDVYKNKKVQNVTFFAAWCSFTAPPFFNESTSAE